MAYQPKSYRKFLAGTVSAALVASAIGPVAASAAEAEETVVFPDLPSNEETAAAITELVEAGVIKGINGEFKPYQNVSRGQVAVMLARALGYDTASHEFQGTFKDLKEGEVAAAVEFLAAEGFVSTTNDNYRPLANITRQEMASLLVRTFGLEADGESKVTDLDKAWSAHRENVEILSTLGITTQTTFNPLNDVSRSQFALFLKRTLDVVGQVGEGAIASVEATGANKITVNFKSAVKTEDATFTVKRGASTLGVKEFTWNEAKTSVELEMNNKLIEGKYEVTVAGLSEEALTGSVEVQNEKVAAIEFASDSLVISGNDVKVGVNITNQYGEKINASSPTVHSTKGTGSVSNGVLTLTGAEFKVNDKVVVTLIDASGLTKNATLTVVAEAKASAVTIGDVYHKDGKVLSEDNKEGFFLLVEAKDQYGNVLTDLSKLNSELTILNSNSGVVSTGAIEKVTIDKKDHFGIKLTGVTKGSSNIAVVPNATGATVSKVVTVQEGVKVDTVEIGSPDTIVAGSEKALVPVTAVDNKGAAITSAKTLNDNLSIGVTGGANPTFVEKDGNLYIEVTTNEVAKGSTGNLILSVTTQTNKFSNRVIQVRPDAVATYLIGLKSDVATGIFQNESFTLENKHVTVQDQYGREMANDKFFLDVTTANAANIKVEGTKLTALKENALVTIGVKATASGDVVSSTDVRFNTVTIADFKSYKVAEIGTLYSAASVDAAYKKDLKVYGVTANGSEVLVPAGQYNVVGLSNLTYDAGKLTAANNLSADKTETKAASGKIVINATGDELTFEGNISNEAPKAAKAEYKDGNKVVTELGLELTSTTLAVTDLIDGLVVTDQYGVGATVAEGTGSDAGKLVVTYKSGSSAIASVVFSNLVNIKDGTAAIASNGTSTAKVNNVAVGTTVNARVNIGGVSTTVALKVTKVN